MLRHAMPGVVRQPLFEVDLRRQIKLLACNAHSGDRDTRRQLLGPQHRCVLDGHQEWIGLQLDPEVQLDITAVQGLYHGLAQVVVRWTQRQPWNRRSQGALGPYRVLHRLALAEQIRYTTEVKRFERTDLDL